MLDNLQPDLMLPTPPPRLRQTERQEVRDEFSMVLRMTTLPVVIAEAEELKIVAVNEAARTWLKRAEGLEGMALGELAAGEESRQALRRCSEMFYGLQPVDELEGFGVRLLDAQQWESECEIMAVPVASAAGQRLIVFRMIPNTGKPQQEALEAFVEHEASNYSKLLEEMVDGFIEIAQSGLVTKASASAQRLLNLNERQLVGKKVEDVFPTLTASELIRVGQAQEKDQTAASLVMPMVIGGEPHQFEFKAHEQGTGLGVMFRDVTEQLRTQLEIAKLNATTQASQELLRSQNEELNKSLARQAILNEQLTKADSLKGEFLANTSHELRTPLNAIIGSLQLVEEGLCEDAEEQSGYIKTALTSAKQLLALINDLLDITKIEAGKMTFLVENCDVEELFQELYSLTNVPAQQKGLTQDFTTGEHERLTIRADMHKTIQVFLKIIGNAIKFTDKGRVTIQAAPDPANADMVRFEVVDTGIGVPRILQQQIFEKFTQGDGSTTRRHEGTGLGLAITRNLVEMMGGTIGIFSEGEGCGTKISLTLPRAHVAAVVNTATLSEADIDALLPDTF